MAYQDANTLWRFTVPQAGEVDSTQAVTEMLEEVDDALISPMAKAELTSNGAALNPSNYTDGSTSKYSSVVDGYWSSQEGRNIYVTRRHYHPTPDRVPNADSADSATRADSADYATNAYHASNADSATSANHATTADSANEASHATRADNATRATNADNATSANHATTADNATSATRAANADNATNAANATRAANADNATKAGYLSPGFKLNGITITGKPTSGTIAPSHTLKLNDIPDAPRVFWGSQEPSNVSSFPALRKGDLYVKII